MPLGTVLPGAAPRAGRHGRSAGALVRPASSILAIPFHGFTQLPVASFAAALHVAGHVFPVTHCSFGATQATHQRGQVSAKVRYGPVQLVLDVPDSEALAVWAADPHKKQPASVVFLDADGGQPVETLRLPGAYCIRYHEQFVSSEVSGGAYQCVLTLSDPAGWTIMAGGPARAFVAPAARDHGGPGANVLARTHLILNESDDSPLEANGMPASEVVAAAISPELAAILVRSIVIEPAGDGDGPDLFQETVKAHLQEIYNTKTGRVLLNSLHASGKQTIIQYPMLDNLNRALIPKDATSINNCFYQADGTTTGAGQGIAVNYSPAREFLGGPEQWQNRPPAIGLAHELIHAEQAAYGRMRRGKAINPGVINKMDATKPAITSVLELETVGVPPHDKYHVSENKIRGEWIPPQPVRPRY